MAKYWVNSETRFAEMVKGLREEFKEHKCLEVTAKESKRRSLPMNSLWAAMYKRLVEYSIFEDVGEAKKYVKLNIAVPILIRECEEFRAGWNRFFVNEQYERLLYMMGPNKLFGPEGYPVTRLLSPKQGKEFTRLIADHESFVEFGVNFEDMIN